MRVERDSGGRCQALPGAQSRWDGARCPQGSWSSASVHRELPQGPFPSLLPGGHRKRGAGPEKGARSLNELRKAHLLAITAQGSAITSCRERQDVCLGAAACGSPTARVCPSLPEPEGSSGSSPRGSEGEEHFPFPTHPGRGSGRMREQQRSRRVLPWGGNSSAPGGRSPGVPPPPRVRL